MRNRIISWWSAGVTSAVATYYAVQEFGDDLDIYYCDTGKVHPDNKRFIKECEQWYGKKINIIKAEKYEDPFDVARKTRWINGPSGARCSLELKKNVRYIVEDIHDKCLYNKSVFGFEYTTKEVNRAVRFVEQEGQAPNPRPIFPLIDRRIDKPNALYILENVAKIKKPRMYELGFPNNNCIGCLKANSQGYWSLIKKIGQGYVKGTTNNEQYMFADIYNEMAEIERDIGASVITRKVKNKETGETTRERLYLDELPEDSGRKLKPIVPECGVVCQLEFTDKISEKTEKIMKGQLKMEEIW